MSTPTPAPAAPTSPARSVWEAWRNFWFRPADPTTVGFIRICTGLLVLYIHAAYSLDLQAFFGKHGWYAAEFIDRERHETPTYTTSWTWDKEVVLAQISEYPHRRKAMLDFLRDRPPGGKTGLPPDPAARASALRFLNRVNAYPNPLQFQEAMNYFRWVGTSPDERKHREPLLRTDPAERERYLTALAGGKVEAPVEAVDGPKALDKTHAYLYHTPQFFRDLPAAEKAQLADEVRAFWNVLPAHDEDAWKYVLDHFIEQGPDLRKALVEFVNTLPADTAERAGLLDYFEYWNRDKRAALRTGSSIFSVWFHVSDPTAMALTHAGVIVVILLFTAGLFTRVTAVLTWLLAVMYIHRTQQVLFGMDTMMNILLVYLMVGNCGAALSLDRLIARYRATRASLARSGTLDANTRAFLACPPPSRAAGFAIRLIQVHFCFIYLAAGLSKLKGAAWWDGRAFWDVVVNPEFTPMIYPWYETGLRWMASWKPLYSVMAALGVWFTLFVEIATPFLVWTRARWFVVLLATAMHAAIGVLMGLNLFELLMVVMLLAFLPDRAIRDRFRGGPTLPRLAFAFDPQNPAHARAAALAVALDVDNQTVLKPQKGVTATAVTGPDGTTHSGPEGTTAVARGLRLLTALPVLMWVPGVKGLLTRRLFPAAASPPPAGSGSVLKPPAPTARR